MSNVPNDLKYTETHEWVKAMEDGTLLLGITDHAQDLLGDMVFVDLHAAGEKIETKAECAVVESVKAAYDVYMPVSGEIIESNSALGDTPEIVNQDPYGKGWMLKIKPDDANAVGGLMDANAYQAFLESEDH